MRGNQYSETQKVKIGVVLVSGELGSCRLIWGSSLQPSLLASLFMIGMVSVNLFLILEVTLVIAADIHHPWISTTTQSKK
jgi:hypothetical protein